ncbi:MAG TPA: LysM peptidoglycan-binding domain-containing protein [Nevskiaceae bacterium]|nr:LysM peptidoglycan-binding domain-containing protein [Nevskiaceae bacterium]
MCLLLASGEVFAAGDAAQPANPLPANPGVQLMSSQSLSDPSNVPPTLRAPEPAPLELPAARPVARASTLPPWDESAFPHYPLLRPAVSFWTDVFGDYSELQSVIHSENDPSKVFKVLDFRADAERLDDFALARKRANEENRAKDYANLLLKQVHELRHTPEKMNAEQRYVYNLYDDQKADDLRFKKAIGTLRAQRGLKERTEKALDTASGYLPQMESIFKKHDLPTQLTRLPLVESSFNVEAYSKVGAAGLWQFMPSSARIYMRLDEVVDDRRDPWTSTEGAAGHLADDYAELHSWPLALTAYNHGRAGIARGLAQTHGTDLTDLIERYRNKNFGFASKNFYAEFLAASAVERRFRESQANAKARQVLAFDTVETKHYVPYETLRKLCGADDEVFRKLNPAYRPEVIEGKLYVPPGHIIRVPAGTAKTFEVAYEKLGSNERFDEQKVYYILHKVGRGDSLGRIARKYGVAQRAILDANGLKDGKRLKVGTVLRVPPRTEKRLAPITVAVGETEPAQTRDQKVAEAVEANYRVHKVQLGQTLGSIAKRYKVSVASLRAANNLGNSSHIRPGQKLKVPANS